MLRVVPLRAGSAQHYAAADALRALANSELLRGSPRLAAQLYFESKVLRIEGEALLEAEERQAKGVA